jgi:glycosyltransferase involved in cell wall biosynthesis|tara:strand:+ start:3359 stop:4549 length:1191 start_codon:yes stop_codon:yes gene_type:complete
MKLLCISPFNSDDSTVINRTLPLLQKLTENGYEVDVVFPSQGTDGFYKRFDRLNHIFLNSPGKNRSSHFFDSVRISFRFLAHPSVGRIFYPLGGIDDLALTFSSVKKIPDRGYDGIYISKPWLRTTGLGTRLAKRWRIPLILDLDDYDIWEGSFLLKNFQGIVVASRELENLFKNFNSIYIPNSTNLTVFNPSNYPPRNDRRCVIVWSGIMYESLRLEMLLDAFKIMREEANFMFLGKGGSRQKLISYSKTLGLEERLMFQQWGDKEAVPRYLSKANIGVIHVSDNLYERCKCPGKLFEYMAMELPIVASNIGEPAHVVSRAKCGILVSPDNPSAMAGALDFLAQNPEERHRMGKNGREYLLKNQNFNILGSKLLGFVDSLLNNQGEMATAQKSVS